MSDTKCRIKTTDARNNKKKIIGQGIDDDKDQFFSSLAHSASYSKEEQASNCVYKNKEEQWNVIEYQDIGKTNTYISVVTNFLSKLYPAPTPRKTIIIVGEWNPIEYKTLGRALDPRANGTWLSKLTE